MGYPESEPNPPLLPNRYRVRKLVESLENTVWNGVF